MKNIIRYMAGLLACGVIAAAISSCGGGGSSPQVQTLQGGPLGGVLVDPINKVTIQTPPGVASQDFQITISALPDNFETIEVLDGRTIPSSGRAFEIDVDLAEGLDLAVLVTIPYDVNKAPDPSRVGVVFLDESTGKWVSVDVVDVDPINQSVTFLTSHLSTWMSVFLPNVPFRGEPIETGFQPGVHGFPFSNAFPSPYDVILRGGRDFRSDIDGNCTGMSMLAVSLYQQRLPVGEGLYSRTTRVADFRDPSYFSIYQGINLASSLGNGFLQSVSILASSAVTSIDSSSTAPSIYRALKSQDVPILLTISRRSTGVLDSGDKRHMVVVYRYMPNPDGSGEFFYYDPNFPFRPDNSWIKSFVHRADGSVVSFNYNTDATPVMAGNLYISSGSSSALTPEFARSILSRNFSPPPVSPAPICLASVPPSGTLPFLSSVCVDDGSCPTGQVLQLIGGNNAAIPPIPRQSSCVPRNTPLPVTACLSTVPPDGSIPYLTSVCVDNGSCPAGEVLQLIGGNNSATPPIPRLSSCVAVPPTVR